MKLCYKILAIAIITSTSALMSCSGPSNFTYQNVVLSVQFALVGYGENYPVNPIGDGGITGTVLPQCSSSTTATGCNDGGTVYCNSNAQCTTTSEILLPPGGSGGSCLELYASVTNAALNPTWTIYPSPPPSSTSSNVGGFNSPSGGTTTTGPTAFYCEPGNPPIYSGAQLTQTQTLGPGGTPLPQGTTAVVVTNPIDPANPANVATTILYFAYQSTGPSTVAIGMSPTLSAVVPLGGTLQFTGYVAGQNGYGNPCSQVPAPATSIAGTALTWEAGPSQGTQYVGGNGTGAGQYGTIVATGPNTAVYTAPTAYPSSTVHSAVVVLESTACINPTTQKSAVLTGGGSVYQGTSTTITFP
jgi:hypothetical protein